MRLYPAFIATSFVAIAIELGKAQPWMALLLLVVILLFFWEAVSDA